MVGIKLTSTADVPRPTEPLMLSNAEVWRRLPLIKTRVWSGPRPRRVAGRITSVPSVIDGCGKLKLGTSWVSARLTSMWPVLARRSAEMTSTGTGESATVRSVRRVPVTTMVADSGTSWLAAWPAVSGVCADAPAVRAIGLRLIIRVVRIAKRVIGLPPWKQRRPVTATGRTRWNGGWIISLA